MACIRLLDGTDVVTTAEYFLWREELRGQEDGDCFFNTLRRHLAKRLLLPNFRQLALAGDRGMLGPECTWENAECLTAIKRQYVETATGEATCIDLLQAAGTGDAKHVIVLLEKPHDPNAADRNSHVTPLFNASANGHLEVVQCLLDAGADKEKPTNEGATPLHIAAGRGHQAVVQCLLDAGADKEKADNDGATSLHLAADQGHQAVVQCLLDAGADKDKADNDGAAPLHYAARDGHQGVAQCLLDAGADKDKADNDGATPRRIAAVQGYEAVAQCLLDAPATKRRRLASVQFAP
ncbi:unnamed protein product [Effrenium voratum]|nr:unnamed protein product [Effrenium voratum]